MGVNENVEDGFPAVPGEVPAGDSGASGGNKEPFVNRVFPNDSVTECSGFINEFRSHSGSNQEEPLYFVRVGLIQGSVLQGEEWKGDIVNCDLLVGSTLKKWAEAMLKLGDSPVSGVRFNFVIKNLKFYPEIYEGNPVLRNRGVLEVLSAGHLNR